MYTKNTETNNDDSSVIPKDSSFLTSVSSTNHSIMKITRTTAHILFLMNIFPEVSCFAPNLPSQSFAQQQPTHKTSSFSSSSTSRSGSGSSSILFLSNNPNRYEKELEEKAAINARINAQANNGVGSVAAGAILGGLVGGPFGAVFGASIGNRLGATNAVDKARKVEMEKMGITQEMLDQAKEMGMLLDRGFEGLRITEDSLRTQQNFAKRLEQDVDRTYSQAKAALGDGDEEKARDFLFKKTQIEEKLKKALMNCVEEKKRLSQMENNVRAIEERALEMESLLKRSVGAKTTMDTSIMTGSGTGFSLAPEDPLLKKFKDAGID
jgi:hypothetical protein